MLKVFNFMKRLNPRVNMSSKYELTEKDIQKLKQIEIAIEKIESQARKMETLINSFSAGGDPNDPFFVDKVIKKCEEKV